MTTAEVAVLFWMDDGGHAMPGGNVTQLLKTADALRRAGCRVTTSTSQEPDLHDVDIVHGFNLNHERVRRLRTLGIPVALSTIYWPLSFRAGARRRLPSAREGLGRLSVGGRLAYSAFQGRYQLEAHRLSLPTRRLLMAYESADMLLPNSRLEAEAIARELGVSTPMSVVHNAADSRVFTRPSPGRQREGVVMAARIEPLKNQLRLIRACAELGVDLTLIGSVHPHHRDYAHQCRRRAGRRVRFIDHAPQDGLAEVFRSAQVHALPSWFETTGLVSLEAALTGCAIVTTARGYASEYFGDRAHYCQPRSVRSIKLAVESALHDGVAPELAETVSRLFSWEAAASATLQAYRKVLR